MRKLTFFAIASLALFRSEQSEASYTLCEVELNCPTLALTITDALTGKPPPLIDIPVVNAFELLNFEITATFYPPATGIGPISKYFGFGEVGYTFFSGPPFIQTGGISTQQTTTGENDFFSGYFTAAGFARIGAIVFDNDGNGGSLGGFADPGVVIAVLPAIPEPSTWAMLLIGFAALGFAGYRRSFLAASSAP